MTRYVTVTALNALVASLYVWQWMHTHRLFHLIIATVWVLSAIAQGIAGYIFWRQEQMRKNPWR